MVYCVCVITASGMCGVTKLLVGDIKTYVGGILHPYAPSPIVVCPITYSRLPTLFSHLFSRSSYVTTPTPLHPTNPPPTHTHHRGH